MGREVAYSSLLEPQTVTALRAMILNPAISKCLLFQTSPYLVKGFTALRAVIISQHGLQSSSWHGAQDECRVVIQVIIYTDIEKHVPCFELPGSYS